MLQIVSSRRECVVLIADGYESPSRLVLVAPREVTGNGIDWQIPHAPMDETQTEHANVLSLVRGIFGWVPFRFAEDPIARFGDRLNTRVVYYAEADEALIKHHQQVQVSGRWLVKAFTVHDAMFPKPADREWEDELIFTLLCQRFLIP